MKTSVIVTGAGGRMGSTVCRLALEDPALTLAAVLERPERLATLDAWKCPAGSDPDTVFAQAPGGVVVDFTSPEASLANARAAARTGVSHVIGTTGLNAEQKAELAELAGTARIFWAPNMSVGVNVLLKILPQLVRQLGAEYDLEMVELHHNRKKDSPSGTALRLAECLAEARGWKLSDVANYHREGLIGERPGEEIGIQTIRGGDVVGVHTVYAMGPGERIEITHQAHSRENFAQGALRAAKWLPRQQPGPLYSMLDML